jgi:hypothetical protein
MWTAAVEKQPSATVSSSRNKKPSGSSAAGYSVVRGKSRGNRLVEKKVMHRWRKE